MSREDEAKNDRLFDSRTVERNIRKGLITRKDYDKYLKGLADVTEKIAPPEAPRSATAAAIAAEPELDHFDAGLDDEDDDDQDRHTGAPLDGQSAAGGDDLGDGDIDELDDDDLEDDDEDEVDTEPPKN